MLHEANKFLAEYYLDDAETVSFGKIEILGETFEEAYPGLHPYMPWHMPYFVGREQEIKSVVATLQTNNFVSVIGGSGCGKSSLVYAGILPEVMMTGPGNDPRQWIPIVFKPGRDPLRNLADALVFWLNKIERFRPGSTAGLNSIDVDQALASLKDIDGLAGLIHRLLPSCALQSESSGVDERLFKLLIVVDQFEESFNEATPTQRADLFSVLTSCTNTEKSDSSDFAVLITMRSEYLENCQRYPKLSRSINTGIVLLYDIGLEKISKVIEQPAFNFASHWLAEGLPTVPQLFSSEFVSSVTSYSDRIINSQLLDPSAVDWLPITQTVVRLFWIVSVRRFLEARKQNQMTTDLMFVGLEAKDIESLACTCVELSRGAFSPDLLATKNPLVVIFQAICNSVFNETLPPEYRIRTPLTIDENKNLILALELLGSCDTGFKKFSREYVTASELSEHIVAAQLSVPHTDDFLDDLPYAKTEKLPLEDASGRSGSLISKVAFAFRNVFASRFTRFKWLRAKRWLFLTSNSVLQSKEKREENRLARISALSEHVKRLLEKLRAPDFPLVQREDGDSAQGTFAKYTVVHEALIRQWRPFRNRVEKVGRLSEAFQIVLHELKPKTVQHPFFQIWGKANAVAEGHDIRRLATVSGNLKKRMITKYSSSLVVSEQEKIVGSVLQWGQRLRNWNQGFRLIGIVLASIVLPLAIVLGEVTKRKNAAEEAAKALEKVAMTAPINPKDLSKILPADKKNAAIRDGLEHSAWIIDTVFRKREGEFHAAYKDRIASNPFEIAMSAIQNSTMTQGQTWLWNQHRKSEKRECTEIKPVEIFKFDDKTDRLTSSNAFENSGVITLADYSSFNSALLPRFAAIARKDANGNCERVGEVAIVIRDEFPNGKGGKVMDLWWQLDNLPLNNAWNLPTKLTPEDTKDAIFLTRHDKKFGWIEMVFSKNQEKELAIRVYVQGAFLEQSQQKGDLGALADFAQFCGFKNTEKGVQKIMNCSTFLKPLSTPKD
jgi:energy-coupling factor transporter ATP-binding protein EcfA2